MSIERYIENSTLIQKPNRDTRLDGLKFILIFLVVLGHLGYDDYGLNLGKTIYTFHMPVFVFLSGYFTSLRSSFAKRIGWVKKTLIIYIVAQIFHVIVNYFMDYPIGWQHLYIASLALWYLISLVWWRLISWLLVDKIGCVNMFWISILLCIVSGFIPIGEELSFQRTFAFMPFFMMGLVFKERKLITYLDRIPYWATVMIFLFSLFIARKYLDFYMPKCEYDSLEALISRFGSTCMGVILTLSIVRMSDINIVRKFAPLGALTLWIYIGHTYMVRLCIAERIKEVFGFENYNIIGGILLAIFYCGICICIRSIYIYCSKRFRKVSDKSLSLS